MRKLIKQLSILISRVFPLRRDFVADSSDESTAPRPQLSGRVFEDLGIWGQHIDWWKFEERRVWGHWTPLPKQYDELRKVMGSGKTARFVFLEVEPQSDPKDMFFAKVADLGYVGEPMIADWIDEARPVSSLTGDSSTPSDQPLRLLI